MRPLPTVRAAALRVLSLAVLGAPALVGAQNSAPVVTNVVATQLSGTGTVRVTYDVSDAEGDLVTARLICSSDNGVTFDLLPVSVSGDVNTQMTPGPSKTITWNAAADYPGRFWPQVVAKVYAADGPALGGEMLLVPAGDFTMGTTGGNPSEQPVHVVYLDAFYVDKFEVTNAEFQRFMDAGGYTTRAFWSDAGWSWRTANNITVPAYWGIGQYHSGPDYPGFPIVGISYYEAEAFANFVGKRLPTEAEWEKAARGTDARTYPWGEGIDPSRANYYQSGDPYEPDNTTPVGFYDGRLHPSPPFQTTDSPSPYGAYDQAGNVWEWVRDWYSSTYYSSSPAANPQGPATGTLRVLRGASWGNGAVDLRSTLRYWFEPYVRIYRTLGFRCARSAP